MDSCNTGAAWLLDNGPPDVLGNLKKSCAKVAQNKGCEACGHQ